MQEKISIIVPIYKVEKYLDKCIQSIVNQTYSNIEIILVDDGSPDGCPEICDIWSRKDSRIHVIHQENAGLSAARNTGIRAAHGAYLCFVDSDDWIALNLCEEVMQIFANNDVGIVVFDCERVAESSKNLGGTETLQDGVLLQKDALRQLLCGNINNYAVNKVYKREVFDDIWFPVGRTFEDMAVVYRLFLNTERIYCLNQKMYFYLQRSDSLTASMSGKKLEDIYLARREQYYGLKEFYPVFESNMLAKVTLCARRLYDRSLWERVDQSVLSDAKSFLQEYKGRILREIPGIEYKLYFYMPRGYMAMRLFKHRIGVWVRRRKEAMYSYDVSQK